jgi:7-keto-8-aminopelargonate synthetase-like enzyme
VSGTDPGLILSKPESDPAMLGPSSLPQPQTAAIRPSHVAGMALAAAGRLDFAAADPLNLRAAHGRPVLNGASAAPLLSDRMARFLMHPAAQIFASGCNAVRQTLTALIGPSDTVILDAGADLAMFETVLAIGCQLLRCPPGSADAVERRLFRLARQRRTGGVFVIVPAVARLTSVAADLPRLSELCAAHDALLVADLSQDLGLIGQTGQGMVEVQGISGRIDVLLGDLTPAFAASGGFASFRDPGLATRVDAKVAAEVETAPLMAAFDLIDSPEGARRRRILHGNALRLRNHLMADGQRVMGHPSPVVPVLLPPDRAEALTDLMHSAGVTLPLFRAPEVAGHAPRWLIRLGARHGAADIDDLADLLHDVTRAVARRTPARRQLEETRQP